MIDARICACGCGASLAGLRADALYQSEACKKRAQRAASRDKAGTEALDDVRAQHEESKGHWTVIVREQLNRCLLVDGEVSAECFDHLGIPPEHSNLANAQMGSYVNRGLMEPISWHRSKKPSRKSGKVWVFRITPKGRTHLSSTLVGSDGGSPQGGTSAAIAPSQKQEPISGLDAGNPEGTAGGDSPVNSRPAPSTGRDRILGGHPRGAGSASGVQPGDGPTQDTDAGEGTPASVEGAPTDSSLPAGVGVPGTLQLNGPKRPSSSMYDPFEDAA